MGHDDDGRIPDLFQPLARGSGPRRGLVAEALLLQRTWLLGRRRALAEMRPGTALRLALLVAVALGFALLTFAATRRLVLYIMAQEALGGLRIVLLAKLTSMLFLLFLLMLTYSNLVGALGRLYLDPDLWLLMTAPLRRQTLFWTKGWQALMSSSWMVVGFGLPIFFAYGAALEAPPSYYGGVSLLVGLFLLIPWLTGLLLALLLMRSLPARGTRQALGLVGVLFAIGLVVTMRLLQPADVVNQVGLQVMVTYLEGMRVPEPPYLPSTWAMEGVMSLVQGVSPWPWIGRLVVLVAALFGVTAFLEARTYLRGFHRSQAGVGHVRRRAGEPLDEGDLAELLDPEVLRPVPPALVLPSLRQLVFKEARIFVRDSSQWSQAFVLLALIALFALNFFTLPHMLYDYAHTMTYVGVMGAGFIVSAVLLRFGLTAVSLEGTSMWVLRSAPVPGRRLLLAKAVWVGWFSLVVALSLALSACVALDASIELTVRAAATATAMTIALAGSSVGIGAYHPRFGVSDPSALAFSLGGILYMMTAIAVVVVLGGLMVLPDVSRAFPEVPWWSRTWSGALTTGLQGVIALAVAGVSVEAGARRLDRLEL